MKKYLYIVSLLLIISCVLDQDKKAITVYTISNQQKIEQIDFSFLFDENNDFNASRLNFDLKAISGEEIIETIEITPKSSLAIKTRKLGIAHYQLTISSKEKRYKFEPKTIKINIVSQFLLDFTQSKPMEPTGSIHGISYPGNAIVQVAKEIIGVDKEGNRVMISPGLLVNKQLAAIPHNSHQFFPGFDEAIKYYGYKENDGEFSFRYQPLIPMLEVGNGNDNRGVGIIVLNKNQIMNDPKIRYEFEGYCSIRTRSDDQETYNLGVVIGTINKGKATFKDVILARDYFNIGYSSSGQIFSKRFNMENDDYLTINIIGEAGLGGDSKRTTRFEYIKISPVFKK